MVPDLRFFSPALASLLLVLAAVSLITVNIPFGLPVGLVSRHGYPPGVACVEQRLIIVRIDANRDLHIDAEPARLSTLVQRLEEIMQTRAERIIYVSGASELSYGEVAELIEVVRQVTGNVYMLTPSSEPTMAEPLLEGKYPLTARRD
jgi:biopolymer transport protein ExbD